MLSRFPFPLDIALLLPSPFFASSLSSSLILLSLLDFFFFFTFVLRVLLLLLDQSSFSPAFSSLSLSPLSFLSSALPLLFLSKFPPSPLIPVASLYLYYLSLDLRLRSLSIPCFLFHCISPEFLFFLFSLSLFRPLPSRLVLTFMSHFSTIPSLTTDVSFSLSSSVLFFPFSLSSDSSLNSLFRLVFRSFFSLSLTSSRIIFLFPSISFPSARILLFLISHLLPLNSVLSLSLPFDFFLTSLSHDLSPSRLLFLSSLSLSLPRYGFLSPNIPSRALSLPLISEPSSILMRFRFFPCVSNSSLHPK